MNREVYIDALRDIFSLVEVLSAKNNCQVLRLRHKESGKDMVLRSFPQKVAAYEALVSIRCENLPEVYDVIDLDDGQIVLEEYIDGVTVAQAMELGRFHRLGAKRILLSLCHATAVLHQRGLVHRDIKPENVMLRDDGTVVLIDLNAARKISQANKDTVIMGTVGYVSPEQLGLSQTDARTDIYAAGVLYNVMLTGVHPSIHLVKGKAGRIVRKCTAVSPEDRYQSAQKLADAL